MKTRKRKAKTQPKTKQKCRDNHVSRDGKWKSFPKVPHLLQYIPTAAFYARVKVHGKLVRKRLKAQVFSTAKLLLSDFLKEHRSKPVRSENAPVTFAEARLQFEAQLEARHDLQSRAKEYRRGCINILLKTWPGLDCMKLTRITETHCHEWSNRFLEAGYDEQRYMYRGKLAQSRLEKDCLTESAEVFKTVCVDAGYYRFPDERYIGGLVSQVPSDFVFTFKVTDEITIKKFTNLPRHGVWAGKANENYLNAD